MKKDRAFLPKQRRVFIILLPILLFVLISCTLGDLSTLLQAAPPQDQTAAAEAAIQQTVTALFPTATQPSATATPSLTSTPLTHVDACDWAVLVKEQLSPVASQYPPGFPFQMKWQLKNVGTCTWNKKYAMVFYSGSDMGGAQPLYLTQDVPPGGVVELVLNLTAPASNGKYTGLWKFRNADNKVIGIGGESNPALPVTIQVGGPTVTPGPTKTATPTITLAGMEPDVCDAVQSLSELTVPDANAMPPGVTFTRLFRLRNIGGCTWSKKYALIFDSGQQLGAPQKVFFPEEVAPGQTIDLYVQMKSPNTAGTYTGYWKILNDVNTTFGTGPAHSDPIPVKITVTRSITNTSSPATLTKTVQAGYTRTPTRTATPTGPTPTRGPAYSWVTYTTIGSQTLNAIDYASPNDVWAVGNGGTIVRWNGAEWSLAASPTSNHLLDVDMLSINDGWAVGEGVILRWNG